MSDNKSPIISKVWSFCTVLKDDGVSYGDYLEQLTYLLFLKMAQEYAKPPYNRKLNIPDEYTWENLSSKSGAGQYFTPRALIRAMVACMRPKPMKTIADPSCGTGGFFLVAHEFIANPKNYRLDRNEKEFLKFNILKCWEIVSNTYRLCLMNLFLHNIGDLEGSISIIRNDALLSDPSECFDYVLANPLFGKKK